MKSLELKATEENLIELLETDRIRRNDSVLNFIRLLDALEDNSTIALDGRWGSGKTFFVKQVKLLLDSINSQSKKDETQIKISGIWEKLSNNQKLDNNFVVVYFDAWENDDEDPLLSLIYGITYDVFGEVNSLPNDNLNTLFSTIIDCTKLKMVKEAIEKNYTDYFKSVKNNKELKEQIRQFISALLQEKGNRLIIIVDELDRCNPIYAMSLLEKIKHFFDNDLVTFVFSINIHELQHTIKQVYGQDFDGLCYLDRFFDLRVTLPKPYIQGFYDGINFNASHYTYDIAVNYFVKTYELELRQITKFIRVCQVAAYEITHNNDRRFKFSQGKATEISFLYILPVVIGLKLYNAEGYKEFISGRFVEPLLKMYAHDEYPMFGSSEFLNKNETYSEEDENKNLKLISVEDKINEIYNAIFTQGSQQNSKGIMIGDYTFDIRIKDKLIDAASLLSSYMSIIDK